MHARIVRGAIRSAALATAMTGTLTWAPTATAQSAEPTPSASTASTETPAPDAGSVAITKTDPAGDPLAGPRSSSWTPPARKSDAGRPTPGGS